MQVLPRQTVVDKIAEWFGTPSGVMICSGDHQWTVYFLQATIQSPWPRPLC